MNLSNIVTRVKTNIAIPCALAFAFIGASLYTMVTCKDCQPFKDYENSLSPQLKIMYQKSIEERTNLYLYGTLFGLILAFATTYGLYQTLNPFTNGCLFTLIVTATQYLYYTLVPKQIHMLPNLETAEQVDGWYDVYQHMRYRYHMGFLLGLIGFFILSFTLKIIIK